MRVVLYICVSLCVLTCVCVYMCVCVRTYLFRRVRPTTFVSRARNVNNVPLSSSRETLLADEENVRTDRVASICLTHTHTGKGVSIRM